MNNFLKKTMVLATILLIAMFGKVYAATEFGIKLTSDKTNVKLGDTVKVTVALSNVTSDKGIGAVDAKLEYDKSVFETITSDEDGEAENIEVASGWGAVIYNSTGANEGKFITESITGKGIKVDKDIMTVTFKVLNSAKIGDTTIKVTNVTGTNGTSDCEGTDGSITIKVEKTSATPTPTAAQNTATPTPTAAQNTATPTPTAAQNTATPTPTAAQNTATPTPTAAQNTATPTPKKNTTPTPTPANTTENKIQLPYAGEANIILIAVIAIGLIGAISFVSYKKMKNI